MAAYYDFYCQKCNRLLGKVKGDSEITCPGCGGINKFNFKTKEVTYISRLRKQFERASSSGTVFH